MRRPSCFDLEGPFCPELNQKPLPGLREIILSVIGLFQAGKAHIMSERNPSI